MNIRNELKEKYGKGGIVEQFTNKPQFKYPYNLAEREFQAKYWKWLVSQVDQELITEIEPMPEHPECIIATIYRDGQKANGISIQEMNNGDGMRSVISVTERSFEKYPEFYKKQTNE